MKEMNLEEVIPEKVVLVQLSIICYTIRFNPTFSTLCQVALTLIIVKLVLVVHCYEALNGFESITVEDSHPDLRYVQAGCVTSDDTTIAFSHLHRSKH